MHVKKEKIYPTYVSKHNSNSEKKVLFLMISNGERWHYQKLIEITLKYQGDFYCLNYLHSFRTKNKLESHKKVCENVRFL